MRRIQTSEVWQPHDYQTRAVAFLMQRNNAALFLQPGLGKTSSTLAAFTALKEQGMARKMLVVAPKRVCYLVWRQEGERWAQFQHLKFSLLHGRKKAEALAEDSDVYVINPEGIPWLVKQFASPTEFAQTFDTVVIDELTKFKNPRSKRWKTFYPYVSKCARRWGLTGTPAPNGLIDLFGQVKLLDDGNALGKYVTKFRDTYFIPGYDGYSFRPRSDAEEKIQERLRPIALQMNAADYLTLPDFVDDIRRIQLEPSARKQYNQMKQEMVADLDGGTITADNAAGVYSKLKQMAGGAVYRVDKDGNRTWERLHDAKLDALEELVEELAGNPLLVAYEFNHELERILERFGDIPYLGKGTSDKDAVEIERAWNANEIPILPVHPASSGHGLNLQKGSAHHICWFNPTWDFELYDQLVRRLYRQGSKAATIFNHILAVDKTIDFLVLAAIKDKDTTQARLVHGLREVLGTTTQIDTQETTEMTERLKPSGWGAKAASKETAAETADKPKPSGWGAKAASTETAAAPADKPKPSGWGAKAVTPETPPQGMEEKLTSVDAPVDEPVEEPKPRKRRKKQEAAPEPTDAVVTEKAENSSAGETIGRSYVVSLSTDNRENFISISGGDVNSLLDTLAKMAKML